VREEGHYPGPGDAKVTHIAHDEFRSGPLPHHARKGISRGPSDRKALCRVPLPRTTCDKWTHRLSGTINTCTFT
jgi:hypothetical protein